MRHTFVIPGRPQVKQRPRLGRRRGRTYAYTPEATQLFEQWVADSYGDGPYFSGPVKVTVKLHKDKTVVTVEDTSPQTAGLRGDLDNYVKAVLDGLNKKAWKDDRQVVRLSAAKS